LNNVGYPFEWMILISVDEIFSENCKEGCLINSDSTFQK
jgi:hypothetical protein